MPNFNDNVTFNLWNIAGLSAKIRLPHSIWKMCLVYLILCWFPWRKIVGEVRHWSQWALIRARSYSQRKTCSVRDCQYGSQLTLQKWKSSGFISNHLHRYYSHLSSLVIFYIHFVQTYHLYCHKKAYCYYLNRIIFLRGFPSPISMKYLFIYLSV